MGKKEKVDFNGLEESESSLRLSVKHSGFYYGLSVYETCLVRDSCVAFYAEHIERLKLSLGFIQLKPEPVFWEQLKQRITRLINSEVGLYRLRIILSPRDSLHSESFDSVLILTPIETSPDSISLLTASLRKPFPNPFPSFLKISSNHYSLLSFKEAKSKGFDEGLMLTVDGKVSEGSYCNLFWYKDSRLFTPALHCSILEGVTRSKIILAAERKNLPVVEGEFLLEDMREAEQIYISSSTRGLVFVRQLDNRLFSENEISDIVDIKSEYNNIVESSLREW